MKKKHDDRTELVSRCIWGTHGGRFDVEVSVNRYRRRARFDTLEEAETWRDEQVQDRKGKVRRQRSGTLEVGWEPVEARRFREEQRAKIAAAPRTTEIRDGREFTVVHLPDVPHEYISWHTLTPEYLRGPFECQPSGRHRRARASGGS